MAEEYNSDYHIEYSALNFMNLYIKAGDKALFLDLDIDLAMQFYHLAGLWWGNPRSFTVKSPAGKWQLMERRFNDILNNGGKNIRNDKPVSGDVLIPLAQVINALERGDDNVRIVELANEGFSVYGQALEKAGDNLQLLRELVITFWALKKFSLLPALCCLKDESPEVVRTLTDNAKATVLAICLPDAPTYPLRRYLIRTHSRHTDIMKNLLYFACVIDIVRKLQNALRITELEQEMAYYTSLDTLMHMLPARCHDNRDVGKLSVMSLAYMNDPNEGQMLKKYLQSGRRSGDYDARKDAAYPFVFIKCFTSRIDDLPMWEIYGDHAQGVCLVKIGRASCRERVSKSV